MTTTNSFIVHTWTEAPEAGRSADEWPYPTTYTKSLITGQLAQDIRVKLMKPDEMPVFIIEEQISGGYSEYTQETDYSHVLEVNGERINLGDSYDYDNGLNSLLKWLEA
jgi:hypothetical protein